MSATASSSKPTTSVDAAISRNARDLEKELEVERIMKSFKLNPYDILDLPVTATESEIKKQYRKRSLMIHPDKFKHEKGLEAFDFLKKAEGILSDTAQRAEVDTVMTHSRILVLRSILPAGTPTNIPETDPRITGLKPPLDAQIRLKAREVLIEEELSKRRKQKLTYANEGAEAARKEEEIVSRKRKIEDQAKWEERRDDRIHQWRDFAGKKKTTKKSKNTHVLG
ncbi:hypothetical protein P7C73_g1654, partial [Tremellales sp. Uapishka_1]